MEHLLQIKYYKIVSSWAIYYSLFFLKKKIYFMGSYLEILALKSKDET